MRVRDLLTMSTGHHEDDVKDFPYQSEDSVVKAFLARPVSHKPGTFFFYNTPASYMLSAIVQKVTGQAVVDSFASNAMSIDSLALESEPGSAGVSLAMRIAGADQRVAAGYHTWPKGTLETSATGPAEPVAARGAWTSDDTYTMAVARYRTPFVTTFLSSCRRRSASS